MRIRVLGSAAGGGLPQWNCGCASCTRARAGAPGVPVRSQLSLAVSADGARWSLVNASPDVRQQLADFPALHPRPGTRDLPLDSIVLTSAELDLVLGLLALREALSYRILSTAWVRDALLRHNAVFRLLEPAWGVASLDQATALDRDGKLEARLFPVPGKLPGWLGGAEPLRPETCVGLRLVDRASDRRAVVIPGLRELDAATRAEIEAADCALVDGTFFTRDELRAQRPGAPDAVAMGHTPITGPEGTLELLSGLSGRRVYIHMNNTNPAVDAGSREAALIASAGVEIAADGLELDV